MPGPNDPTLEHLDTSDPIPGRIYDLEVVRHGGEQLIFTAENGGDRIGIFAFGDDGSLTSRGFVGDTPSSTLSAMTGLASCSVGTNTYLFAAGFFDSGVTSYRIGRDGTLNQRDAVFDDPNVSLNRPLGDLVTVEFGAKAYLIASGQYDHGVTSFRVEANGDLTAADTIFDNEDPAYEIAGPTDLATHRIDGRQFLFVAAGTDRGISSLQIKRDGSLEFRDSVVDTAGLGLGGVQTVETATIGSKTFLFAGGSDDIVSVFRVARNGDLRNVSNFADTAETALNRVTDLRFQNIGGTNYLFASCDTEDAVNVFRVLNNGALRDVGLLVDSPTTALAGITALNFAELADGSTALVTSSLAQGISSFRFDNSDAVRAGGGSDLDLL